MFGVGFFELIFLAMGGGSALLGLPPGERDANLLRAPPADAVIYVEWAERSAGRKGAAGIDGLFADPEIRTFLKRLDQALEQTFENEDHGGPSPRLMYPLVRRGLVRPGCLFASIDVEALKAAIEKTPVGDPAWGLAAAASVRAALIINAGKDADAVEAEILELLNSLKEDEEAQDLKMREFTELGLSVVLHRHENYFILALGRKTVETAVAGLSGKGDGLTKNASLAAGLKKTAVERAGMISWIDLTRLTGQLSEGLGPQGVILKTMSTTLGLDALKSITTTTGVTDGELHQKTFVATNGKTEGILAFAAGRAIKPADIAHLPADSDVAIAASLDGQKIFDALKGIAAKADPGALRAIDSAVEQMENDLGLSLEEDIFGAIGNVWTLHDSPQAGGVLLTGAVLSAEVRDRKKAETLAAKLLGIVAQEMGGEEGSNLKDHEFLGHAITTIGFPRHGPPMQLSVCVTDRHAYLALQPQAIKAHLRFLAEKGAGLDTRVGKGFALPDGEVIGASYIDARMAARLLTTLLPYWGKEMVDRMQGDEVEFDLIDIPSAAAYLPYITPSTAVKMRTPDGVLSETRGGIPLPGGLGPLAGFVGFMRARVVHEFGAVPVMMGPIRVEARPAAVPAIVRPVRDVRVR